MSLPPHVAYLCLQATRQGQASFAHVHEIIAGLERRGWNVSLFEPKYAQGSAPAPRASGRLVEFIRVQAQLKSRARDVDLVYLRAHFATYPTARWAMRQRIPTVQEVNGPFEDLYVSWPWARLFRWLFTPMARWQYRNASALIAVSPQLAAWLEVETGRKDVTIVPNGANTELFHPDATRMGGLPSSYVVFFGAFSPWQGVETALAAIRDPAWPEGVSLVIAGDGTRRPAVEDAAARDARIVYLGVLPYADVPGLIVGSIAGLSPKNRVGNAAAYASPVKPFEILACGVPAIVTDFPGQADLVRSHRCGIVTPPEDPSALARAVAQLAANPEEARAMGSRGRTAVVAEHSWDARAGAVSAVLDSVRGMTEPQR